MAAERRPSPLPWLFMGLALAGRTWLGVWSVNAQSPTYDEPPHLAAGLVYWATGDRSLSRYWHPPLAMMMGAAGPALSGVRMPSNVDWDHPSWAAPNRHFAFARDLFVHNPAPSLDGWIARGRMSMMAATTLMLLIVFLAARAAGGPAAGVIAFLGACFCPGLTAHGALVTADGPGALLFFAAFAALWAWDRRRTPLWAAAAGAAMGAAACTKSSTLVFLPAPLLWFAMAGGGWKGALRAGLAFAGGLLAAVALVYGPSQMPLILETARFTSGLMAGRRTVIFGEALDGRVWYYFPVAFLLKTPLAALAGIGIACWSFRRRWAPRPHPLLWLPAVVYFLAACASPLQIGHRHILPVYPFLYALIGLGLAPLTRHLRGRIVLGALCAGALWPAVAASPFPLSYFNALAGGPRGGHRFLTESNVDWGQGLKALKAHLEQEGVDAFYFSGFGSVNPREYGLKFLDVASINPDPGGSDVDVRREKKALLVVSATNLYGTYHEDRDLFAWLRPVPPSAVLANSLMVYDVTESPAVHRWLAHVLREKHPEAARREAAWAADLAAP